MCAMNLVCYTPHFYSVGSYHCLHIQTTQVTDTSLNRIAFKAFSTVGVVIGFGVEVHISELQTTLSY